MGATNSKPLKGERILIVEDRYLIASDMADEIRRMGGRVIGPSGTVESARQALALEGADIALLDISLVHEDVYPLASQLEEAGVPFIFLTGYDPERLPKQWRGRPRLSKPISNRALREELAKLRREASTVTLG